MTIETMKNLKKGDKVVKVRTHFQNYDYTLIPVEPKVYTISSKNMDINLEENVKIPFKNEKGDVVVYASGCDRSLFCRDYETMKDFLDGNYESKIILDKKRWKNGLAEFLEFKREKDFQERKELIEKISKELKAS